MTGEMNAEGRGEGIGVGFGLGIGGRGRIEVRGDRPDALTVLIHYCVLLDAATAPCADQHVVGFEGATAYGARVQNASMAAEGLSPTTV
jgi:hypothetical protein